MRKLVLLMLFTALAAVFALNLIQSTRQELSATVDRFFSLATGGEPQAADMLAADPNEQEALLEALAVPGLFSVEDIGQAQFHSLSRASVPVQLKVGKDGIHLVHVELEKTQDGWLIGSFPQLVAVPAAIIEEILPSAAVFFSADGNRFTLARNSVNGESEINANQAGLVVSMDGSLVYFEQFAAIPINKLLTVTDETLEGEEDGFFDLADHTAYFRPGQTGLETASKEDFIVGMKDLVFYTKDSRVRAVLLPKDFVPETVRVVLNTTGFGGLGHREVRLTADTPFALTDKVAQSTQHIQAGQTLTLTLTLTADGERILAQLPSGERREFINRIFILPEGGKVRITSLRRGSPAFTPSYHGHLEVRAAGGELALVNEVPLEAYLYSVVPSEMPVSFGLVPLQVQAVAARSYAAASIYRSGFRRYAAHVDDSTASQVYNNVPEYPVSTQAVNDTAGIILTYGGEIADTRFFSTSAGVTANFEEVWHERETGAFPGTPVPYLTSRPQLRSGSLPDVSTEEGARSFFGSTAWDSFDTMSPWFRWDVEMSRTELEAVISRYLPERQKAQPDFVLTQEGSGFVSREISDNPLGELTDLRVIHRGGGGNVYELEITGENGTYRLVKEYTIRFTLRPVSIGGGRDILLQRHDGSDVKNYIILPSTFIVMNINRDNTGRITTVRFLGGGNGHGVGMSQWGVRGLAADGRSFAEILEHYYPGSTTAKAY
ncbi:MAG: SpoIID/LytB domain-containing protein [Bacillota bacterium]|nr:SpoIID/LytB domain-containing protein [Bacillota bacterium]MDW7684429.1 SpoIID/LytB domain-containing protein [Bacillota bacterium]